MDSIVSLLKMLALCAVSFYFIAMNVYYAINMFAFNIPFSKELAEYGVYDKAMHNRLIAGRWTSIILATALTAAIAVILIKMTMPAGLYAALVSLAVGIFRFRNMFGVKEVNIKRFARSHAAVIDKDKFNRFLKEKKNMTL